MATSTMKRRGLEVRKFNWREMPSRRLRGEAVRGRVGREVPKMRLFREKGVLQLKGKVVGGASSAIHLAALFTIFDHHLNVSPS